MPLSFAEIKARFEAEQRTPITPRKASDMPPTYESITVEWLTDVLGREVPGARVLSHTLGPRDDGTSNRRRIEMVWNEAGLAAGLPASVFCKGTQSLASRYMLGMNEGVQAEVNFYTLVRPTLGVIAPEALYARYDPQTLNSIIVMRDLRGEVEFCTMETVLSKAHVKSQLRLLATTHGRFYESPELTTTLAPFSKWETFFTITAVDAGFAEACIRGFTQAKAVIPPRLFAREAEVWPATLRCVARHAELPRMFTHNDLHLKNWFMRPDGEVFDQVAEWAHVRTSRVSLTETSPCSASALLA